MWISLITFNGMQYACEPAVKSFLSTIFIVEQSSAVRIVLCITPVCCPGRTTSSWWNYCILLLFRQHLVSLLVLYIYIHTDKTEILPSLSHHLCVIWEKHLPFKRRWRTAKSAPLKQVLEIATHLMSFLTGFKGPSLFAWRFWAVPAQLPPTA